MRNEKELCIIVVGNQSVFGRIMKEHALFLMAGFSTKNREHVKKADWYRQQFEALLWEVVSISDEKIREKVLCSGEIVTRYAD